ncbi:S16 family serine protease [[Eubacterium] cellulosolvens]
MEPSVDKMKTNLKTALIISILVNILLAAVFLSNLDRPENQSDQYESLIFQNQNLTKTINSMKQESSLLENQLSYYKSQADYYSRLSRSNGTASSGIVGRSQINIVAVRTVSGSMGELMYEGVIMTLHLELREGEGRLLINTEPKIGIDLQTSANTAIIVAEELTNQSLKTTDVILTVVADSETDILDGPSAGAAITVALLAAINDKTADPSILMTGTINPDGSIGKVGGLVEKALASARFDAKKFLVPFEQSVSIVYKTEETHPAPGLTVITTKPELIDIEDYIRDEGYELDIIEVNNIVEVYDLVIFQE